MYRPIHGEIFLQNLIQRKIKTQTMMNDDPVTGERKTPLDSNLKLDQEVECEQNQLN